jgi:hypothetical protein
MWVNNYSRRLSFRDRFRIHEGVSGGVLECGCAFGRYLTYSGSLLTIVDDATACREEHVRGVILQEAPAGEAPGPLPIQARAARS